MRDRLEAVEITADGGISVLKLISRLYKIIDNSYVLMNIIERNGHENITSIKTEINMLCVFVLGSPTYNV